MGRTCVQPNIRNDIRLAKAFATGQPIRYYAPKSRGAADFQQLENCLADGFSKPKSPGANAP